VADLAPNAHKQAIEEAVFASDDSWPGLLEVPQIAKYGG
jgi:hypothetical protein